jgi:hypothetical protein
MSGPMRPHHHPPPEGYFPVTAYPSRPGAPPHPQGSVPEPIGSSSIWSTRAAQVKEAYLHAWNGYQKFAAPFDELLPVSDGKVNK